MTPNIERLLVLAAEFPARKRINYDSNEDRLFCNEVLRAVVKAAPEIKAMAGTVDAHVRQAEAEEKVLVLTTPVASLVSVPLPSIAPSLEPQTERNIHNPNLSPSTGDTASLSGQKSGTADKPLTGLAKVNAERKAAALARKQRSAEASAENPLAASGALPPPPPQATP